MSLHVAAYEDSSVRFFVQVVPSLHGVLYVWYSANYVDDLTVDIVNVMSIDA